MDCTLFLYYRLIPIFFILYAFCVSLLSDKKQGTFFADPIYFLLSQKRQIHCFGFIGAACSGILAGVSMFNTVYNNLIRNYNNIGSFIVSSLESTEYLVGMEQRWWKVLHDISDNKRTMAIMKRNNLMQDEKKKQKTLFRRMLDPFSSKDNKCQNETIKSLKTAEVMQEEAYMSNIHIIE
jgi:hypothetical protein